MKNPNEKRSATSCFSIQQKIHFQMLSLLLSTRGRQSSCIEVYDSCVEAAFSLLATRGRLLWLHRSLSKLLLGAVGTQTGSLQMTWFCWFLQNKNLLQHRADQLWWGWEFVVVWLLLLGAPGLSGLLHGGTWSHLLPVLLRRGPQGWSQ